MNKTVITLIIGIGLGATASWLITTATKGEPTPAAAMVADLPDLPEPYYTVLFENESVRIVDHILEVGDSEPEHTHAPMVAYFVEGATVMITEANDSTWEATIPTGVFLGDSLYCAGLVPPGGGPCDWWTHSLENTGDTPLHSILVEFKGRPTNN